MVNITYDDEEDLRYVDIVMIPDKIAEKLDQVERGFFTWMFDQFLVKEGKAALIAVSSEQIFDTLPILYF